MEKKIRSLILPGIFLAALIIRVVYILTLNNAVDVWGDWWDELGWKLAAGQGFWVDNQYFPGGTPFYSWRAPGFPFFLSLIYRLCGHSFLAAKIGLAVVSSLTAVLIYLIALLIADRKVAIVSAVIFALYPVSIFWTGQLAPETLTGFLLLGMTSCLLSGKKSGKLYWFVLAGVIMGLGTLTRSAFILFLPMVGLWLCLMNRRSGHCERSEAISKQDCRVAENAPRNDLKFPFFATVVCALGCALAVVPWTLRNQKIHHRVVLTSTEGGVVCFIANNERSLDEPSGYWNPPLEYFSYLRGRSEVEIDKHLYQRAFAFIRSNPQQFLVRVGDRFLRYWRLAPHTFSGPGGPYKQYYVWLSLIFLVPLFALSTYGLFLSFRKWREFLLIYLIIIAWSLPVILFFKVVIRYREPIMPFVLMFCSLGIVSWLHNRKRNVEE